MNKLIQNFLEKFRYFLLVLIVILFPLNQQLHIRPFPSIDGVIIDYLIIKISIPELILILFTFFNLKNIFISVRNLALSNLVKFVLFLSFTLIFWNIYSSNYSVMAFYENFIITLILLNSLTLRYYLKIDLEYLISNSLKFWMVVLLFLGLFQIYFQESVLDNYYYFGEFTYNSDNYHIKQKGLIFDELIPAYGIFSHSNIYGGFFLISTMFLYLLKKVNWLFVLVGILGVILSGSMNLLLGLIIFFIFFYLKINLKLLIFYLASVMIFLNIYSLVFPRYVDDLSVYRRLYMVDLSNKFFIENPSKLVFGFGYYNYFKTVSENLYFYEIIRFFQPPHNLFYLLTWNYGLLFLLCLVTLFTIYFKKINPTSKLIFLVLISISMFDHFIFTNHQLKMLLFLVLPYSLIKVTSIKIK